jgi:hypothetical protein
MFSPDGGKEQVVGAGMSPLIFSCWKNYSHAFRVKLWNVLRLTKIIETVDRHRDKQIDRQIGNLVD